jgi:stage II sporulation protein D
MKGGFGVQASGGMISSSDHSRGARSGAKAPFKSCDFSRGLKPPPPSVNKISETWRVFWALLMVAAFSAAALAQSSELRERSTLRVGLWTLWHDKEISVSPAQEPAATLRPCEGCAAVRITHSISLRAADNQVSLMKDRQADRVCLAGGFVVAAHRESLTLHSPLCISARRGELVLVVTLPVEAYVERVVASESGQADSLESMKALAVVVRSFALHQQHGHADYDLCDSTHCQLLHWGQSYGRNGLAHSATLSTAGEALWFHGVRAQAWFHQNCGGRTASPQEVWPSASQGREQVRGAMPWLVSRADSYCTAKGTRDWSASLSLSELTTALGAAGLARPGWKSLTVAGRGESGRAVSLRVGSAEISAEDFRLAVGRAMGWNRILSTWFEVSQQGDEFLFHGRGSGHGVGLCQAGAAAMSALGRDSGQILAQYFPGATVADEATGISWQSLRGEGFVLQTLASADAEFLPQLAEALAEAEARSGLRSDAPITLRALRSTAAFRDATLAPGWVAAFTEGNWIATQPLGTLAARKLLVPVLRHEFLHALVEAQAKPDTPLWLREGLVEAWSKIEGARGSQPVLKLDEVNGALAHAASEAQSEAAHKAAGWYAQRLLDRYGRAQVLDWLHSGLPPAMLAQLR